MTMLRTRIQPSTTRFAGATACLLAGLAVMVTPFASIQAQPNEEIDPKGFVIPDDPFAPGGAAHSQGQPGVESSSGVDHWYVRLGNHASTPSTYMKTVDMVVLVPDEATFLATIRLWGFRDGRFPILIEDDVYAPMFIRRFRPQKVMRLPSVGADSLPSGSTRRDLMQSTVAWVWRNPAEARTFENARSMGEYIAPSDTFKKAGWVPPGVVITADEDSAWLSAVVYAAAYGQALAFLPDDFGDSNDLLSPSSFARLNTKIEFLVKETGYTYDKTGDDIDAITIARDMASRYRSADDGRITLAVTDGLARNKESQTRWGIAGWMFGPTPRTVYAAMSSVFLPPSNAMMFDCYPDADEVFGDYHLNQIPAELQKINMKPMLFRDQLANLDTWHEMNKSGFEGDVLFQTTSGQPHWSTFMNGTRAYTQDVPIANVPVQVYMIHSWSAREPTNIGTIAGRWLENGAFTYVGAVNEPYLQGFYPPYIVAQRMRLGCTTIGALRRENALPWKILTIGDPLARFKTFGLEKVVASRFEHDWPTGTRDLTVLVGDLVVQASETNDWESFFYTCQLIARDEFAMRFFRKSLMPQIEAVLTNPSATDPQEVAQLGRAIHMALPLVFHEGTFEEIAKSIAVIPIANRTRRELDMVWGKANPELNTLSDPALASVLLTCIRTPFTFVDATRLVPAIKRTLGPEVASKLLDATEATATDPYAQALVQQARDHIAGVEEIEKTDAANDG